MKLQLHLQSFLLLLVVPTNQETVGAFSCPLSPEGESRSLPGSPDWPPRPAVLPLPTRHLATPASWWLVPHSPWDCYQFPNRAPGAPPARTDFCVLVGAGESKLLRSCVLLTSVVTLESSFQLVTVLRVLQPPPPPGTA